MGKIQLQPQALEAIAAGINRGDGISSLEDLGLATRTIDILDTNHIITLEQLMMTPLVDLAEIKSLGIGQINQLLKCLNNYHTLELV